MKKKSFMAIMTGITILVLLLVFSKLGFSQNQRENTETLGIPVEIAEVKRESITEALNYIGSVKSKNQLNLSFKQPGILKNLYVDEGDSFQKGDILAELDIEDLLVKQEIVKQKVASAQLNVDYLKDQVEKYQILFEAGAIPHQQLLDLNFKYEMAVNTLKEVLANQREIELMIDNTKIYAPYEGSVREVFKRQDEYLQPGQPVFSLSEDNDLIVEIGVIEKDLANLKIGDKALLSINDTIYESKITKIYPVLNPKTRTALIEIPISGDKLSLLPNMSVRVSLIKGEKENVIAVPAKTLVKLQGKDFVYLYQEGKAQAREVKVGLNNGIMAEISEGLSLEDQIIISNLSAMRNEVKVFIYKGVEGN